MPLFIEREIVDLKQKTGWHESGFDRFDQEEEDKETDVEASPNLYLAPYSLLSKQ
jgi:hypothetical protein